MSRCASDDPGLAWLVGQIAAAGGRQDSMVSPDFIDLLAEIRRLPVNLMSEITIGRILFSFCAVLPMPSFDRHGKQTACPNEMYCYLER